MLTRSISVRLLAALLVAFMLSALAPAGTAEAVTCERVTYSGRLYCASSISQVKASVYPVGTRVALGGVSVTARTTGTVTVSALAFTPCPPGYYCGASIYTENLTVAWTGTTRPAVGSVINLFGTAIVGSLKPVGYAIDLYGCYIDWC